MLIVKAIGRDPIIAGCNRYFVKFNEMIRDQFQNGAFCSAMCECTAYSFVDNNYWSSSENDATNAWNQNFNSGNPGNQNNNTKTNSNYVRAVRR